jgi:predicted NUDIX family NTP pyrophosphohydrolase
MSPKVSAGLLVFRRHRGQLQVVLVHPGGPFWANRDVDAWSIPKGEVDPAETLLDAARREFHEETGFTVAGEFLPLTPARQRSGKLVPAWPRRATVTRPISAATRSVWNGRLTPAKHGSSPRSTAPPGFRSPMRSGRSSPDKGASCASWSRW